MTGQWDAVRAVTVDLDDTLFAQQDWLDGAWRDVAERAGRLGVDAGVLLTRLREVAAEGSDKGRIIDRAVAATGAPPSVVPQLVAAFQAHRPRSLRCYPGVRQALMSLRERVPVVCITDGSPLGQRGKLCALDLLDLLDGVVVSDELGSRALRKPHPAPFLRALQLAGVPASAVVHIGDRPAKDVRGAAGLGVRTVRVRTGEYAAVEAAGPAEQPWREAATFADAVTLLLPLTADVSRQSDSTAAQRV